MLPSQIRYAFNQEGKQCQKSGREHPLPHISRTRPAPPSQAQKPTSLLSQPAIKSSSGNGEIKQSSTGLPRPVFYCPPTSLGPVRKRTHHEPQTLQSQNQARH